MSRGRKKQSNVSMLEAYTNELQRLTMLEAKATKNLESIRQQIQKTKENIFNEEMKEIKEIMNEKNISFEEVKQMLINKDNIGTQNK